MIVVSPRSVKLLLLMVLLTEHLQFITAWISPAVATRSAKHVLNSQTDRQSEAAVSVPASSLRIPLSVDELTKQIARAMLQAQQRGQKRLVVRTLLPRDVTADDFGTYIEDESSSTIVKLVPPDESWQGGIMQLYRAAAPLCESVMRQYNYIRDDLSAGVPPRISEDRSIDESGVDGVSLFQTDDQFLKVYLQPTLEVVDDLIDDLLLSPLSSDNIQEQGVIMLLNPQWRQVDDVLDTASKGSGFFSQLASFLGGKGNTLKRLEEADFSTSVYNFEGYVCRGSNVRLLQVLDSEWAVFCQRDDGESYAAVGKSKRRPTYQDVDAMLNTAGINFKYSRDMGWEPKI
jgi:hypothetical protein